ncbi:MAG: hypothetical protein R3B45_05730 [Bdellovibrionota bacterium]
MKSRTYAVFSFRLIPSGLMGAVLLFLTASCGDAQDPSFVTVDTGKRIQLTVEQDHNASLDATSDNADLEPLTEEGASDILDSIYDSEDQSGAVDGQDSGSGEVGASGEVGSEELGDNSDSGTSSNASPGGEDLPTLTEKELNACAVIQQVGASYVHVIGGKNQEAIKLNSVIAVKVSGNHGKLDLDINGNGGQDSIKGICIFVTGNQGSATLNLDGIYVESLTYIGRGNKSEGKVVVSSDAGLGRVYADLRGNQAKLSVSGDGSYNCGTALVKGHSSSYTCE